MKKLLILFLFLAFWFAGNSSYAQQTVDTGNAVSGTSVTTCANLSGVVCNSAGLLEQITPTSIPGGSSIDGGGGSGGSSSSCGDIKPNNVTNLHAVAGPGAHEVTLSWLPPTGAPYSGFLVAYSDSPTDQKWGNPDIGNVTRFTVSSLGSGTYYFWIAAVNGCKPGDLAGPVTVQTSEAFSYAQIQIPANPTPTPIKTVKGVEEVISAVCTTCIWWPFLLLETIALLCYGYFIAKKKRVGKLWVVLFSIPILTYILFLLFNGSCAKSIFNINAESIFCKYFFLFDLLIFVLYILFGRLFLQKK